MNDGMPRDGSLYGWVRSGRVTTLIVVYTDPFPAWSMMPQDGTSERDWPPFIGQPPTPELFQQYPDQLVDVAAAIVANPGAVFLVPTEIPGAGFYMIAAGRPVAGDGFVIPAGIYVYSGVLRAGTPLPVLADLLADPDAEDVAPRLARMKTITITEENDL